MSTTTVEAPAGPSPTQEAFHRLKQQISQRILGQETLVDRLLIAMLADGHLLVEGAPGLAKTRAIKVLSDSIEANFHRIQFTPDLLPADLTGTDIFRPQDGSFQFQRGPLFHNLILADEINRAPAKVQSALLEAMAERQITVGTTTYPLPKLFLVMATQNPIEQEGTYPLPEAQLDRFLLHVKIDYPQAETDEISNQQAGMPGRNFGTSDLNKLTQSWGVKTTDNKVVGDIQLAQKVSFNVANRNAAIDYPVWMKITKQNLNSKDIITSQLGTINVASPGAITVTKTDGIKRWIDSEGTALRPGSHCRYCDARGTCDGAIAAARVP
ncbi:MAG: AAA family ATPase [Gammaproteobacteria bacterium]